MSKLPPLLSHEITLGGLKLDVHYRHYPASRGLFEKGGGQLSPDEPESYEVEDVILVGTVISVYGLIDELEGLDTIEAELFKLQLNEIPDERENEDE